MLVDIGKGTKVNTEQIKYIRYLREWKCWSFNMGANDRVLSREFDNHFLAWRWFRKNFQPDPEKQFLDILFGIYSQQSIQALYAEENHKIFLAYLTALIQQMKGEEPEDTPTLMN